MMNPGIQREITMLAQEFKEKLTFLSGKTILITGGNGFMGSYFVDLFIKLNETYSKPIKVVIINKHEVTSFSRLGHLLYNKNVLFLTHDMGKPLLLPEKIEYIIHAASRANPKSFLEDPIDTIDANVLGTRNLLAYAKENKVEQFILCSTNEIYGNPLPEYVPTPETYPGNIDPLEDRSCYAESKRLAETLCMAFYRKHHVPVKLARILLAYGPGMRDDGKVITDFIRKVKQKEDILFQDAGDSRRSFCYISDAIRAMLIMMIQGKSGEAYNIANDQENITMFELANVINDLYGKPIKVTNNQTIPPKKIYGVNNRYADIAKIRALGFTPAITLQEGLYRMKKQDDDSAP